MGIITPYLQVYDKSWLGSSSNIISPNEIYTWLNFLLFDRIGLSNASIFPNCCISDTQPVNLTKHLTITVLSQIHDCDARWENLYW